MSQSDYVQTKLFIFYEFALRGGCQQYLIFCCRALMAYSRSPDLVVSSVQYLAWKASLSSELGSGCWMNDLLFHICSWNLDSSLKIQATIHSHSSNDQEKQLHSYFQWAQIRLIIRWVYLHCFHGHWNRVYFHWYCDRQPLKYDVKPQFTLFLSNFQWKTIIFPQCRQAYLLENESDHVAGRHWQTVHFFVDTSHLQLWKKNQNDKYTCYVEQTLNCVEKYWFVSG